MTSKSEAVDMFQINQIRIMMLAAGAMLLSLGLAPARAADSPYSHSWNHPDCPCAAVLHEDSAAAAGLVPQALEDVDGTVSRALALRVAPGAVVLVARRGVIAKWNAYGYASLYKNGDYALADDPRPMQKDEIFDMASVSKLFTAVAIMQLWDEGKFKLDDQIGRAHV